MPAIFELSSLDGDNGVVLKGVDIDDWSGISVSGGGDINDDGINDLLIGAYSADPDGRDSAGETYVVFGSPTGFPAEFNLGDLDSTTGIVLEGVSPGDGSGTAVSFAGDLNHDGIDDLVIGAPLADADGLRDAGESYIVFGSGDGFPARLVLSTLDGTNGFVLMGLNAYDALGSTVAGAGDINGDGIDDLIIGAPNTDPDGRADAGASYVVFGSRDPFPASLKPSALDGLNGFTINGLDAEDWLGRSVAGAGDINGDGLDDLVIGANGADPDGLSRAGEAIVVFGRWGSFPDALDLGALGSAGGFVLDAIDAGDYVGWSVSGAGDINGDGIDDLVVGAILADPSGRQLAGETYLVFGNPTGFPDRLDLSALNGTNGLVINGIEHDDLAGAVTCGVGDVNGDGIDDLFIGAPRADADTRFDAGEGYIIFGSRAGFPASLELDALTGSNGFVIRGIDDLDIAGISASGAGDINGDGIDDLIIGAANADPDGRHWLGETYVVYGSRDFDLVLGETLFGTEGDDLLHGDAGNDRISASHGEDTLMGLGGSDTLYGQQDDDQVNAGAGDDIVTGGTGNDLLEGGDGNDWLAGGPGVDTLAGGEGDDAIVGFHSASCISSFFAGIDDDGDVLSGGAGADAFHYYKVPGQSHGDDVITDFEDGIDRIKLFGFEAEEVSFEGNVATLADGTTITLADFTGTFDLGDVLFV